VTYCGPRTSAWTLNLRILNTLLFRVNSLTNSDKSLGAVWAFAARSQPQVSIRSREVKLSVFMLFIA
jgi:hypothetical protein